MNAGGAAILSNAIPVATSYAQTAAPVPGAPRTLAEDLIPDSTPISPTTTAFADYIAKTLDRELPAEIIATTKLHVLDTLAAIVYGTRLKAGDLAARYVDSLGGKPQATVIGTGIVTSTVNAAFANAMAGHADETDNVNEIGPLHPGCGAVSAALATGELAGRTGNDLLRAVAVGYDIGARMVSALGVHQFSKRYSPSCLTTTFIAAAAAAAMLRLDSRQVRHTFSYAVQQASGMGIWSRDPEHVEKAFDNTGMGARNGVMAATMVGFGFTAVEDPFSGEPSAFTALADKPAPEELLAGLGSSYAVSSSAIKKWGVGAPLQSVLDAVAALLDDSLCAPTTSSTSPSTYRPRASTSSTTAQSLISACNTLSR